MSSRSSLWYIPGKDRQPVGPFTAEQIIHSWRAGRLNPNTLCWREGMSQWLPLSEVEPFSAVVGQAHTAAKPQSLPVIVTSSDAVDRIVSRSRTPQTLSLLLGGLVCVVSVAAGIVYFLKPTRNGEKQHRAPIAAARERSTIVRTNTREEPSKAPSAFNRSGSAPAEATIAPKVERSELQRRDHEWVSIQPGVWTDREGALRLQLIGVRRFGSGEELKDSDYIMRGRSSQRPNRRASDAGRAGETTQEDCLFLDFSITKTGEMTSVPKPLQITIIDTHDNEYDDRLFISLQSASSHTSGSGGQGTRTMSLLPNRFTYVTSIRITLPAQAPIKGIRVGDAAVAPIDTTARITPELLRDFGDIGLQNNVPVPVGKWLTLTCKGVFPRFQMTAGWDTVVHIVNKEYNRQHVSVGIGVQYNDGTLFWNGDSQDVAGSSEMDLRVHLNPPNWIQEVSPQPIAMLLKVSNVSEETMAFRIIPMSAKDMSPFVGQGLDRRGRDLFGNAYRRHGGDEMMGNPVSPVRWLVGGDNPHDEKDVMVQHFPDVSQFGASAILWDKQRGAKDACVIHGLVWREYLEQLQHGQTSLGTLVRICKDPETEHEQFHFDKGFVASVDGKTQQAFPYEEGKIAFASDRDGNREIYVTDPSGQLQMNVTRHSADDWSPAWSPDGQKIAFVSNRDGTAGIYVMDADGSNVHQLTNDGEDPTWFPDGLKLAFVRKVLFTGKNKFALVDSDSSLYGLFIMSADGDSQKRLSIDPRSVRMLPDGRGYAGHIRHPNVSLDGKVIAFSAGNWGAGHSYEICFFEMKSGRVLHFRTLNTSMRGMACDIPVASRDGKKLAFREDNGYFMDMPERGGCIHGGELYRVSFTGAPSIICKKIWCWGGLAWSANDEAIVLSGDYRKGRTNVTNLYIVRLDEHVVRRITWEKGNNYDPSWWVPAKLQQSAIQRGRTE